MWSLPNLLTFSRILMIPVFVGVYFLPIPLNHQLAAVVFLLAAFTDWLDGYLARRMGLTSPLGAFLDPVADKLIVATALVLVVADRPALGLTLSAVVIIGREITISALREWMAEVGKRGIVAVSWLGKFKTVAQMTAITLLVFREPLLGLPTYRIGIWLLYAAVILTLWSMTAYLAAAWPTLSAEEENPGPGA